MSLKDLDIPTGRYKCDKNQRGGASLSAADVGDLKIWGSGGSTYSRLRLNKCSDCPADCPLGGLLARIAEESRSLYPDVDETNE